MPSVSQKRQKDDMLAKINEFDNLGEEFDELVFPVTWDHCEASLLTNLRTHEG